MDQFTKITAENLHAIVAPDLRGEAEKELDSGGVVWHFRTSRSEIVAVGNDRAGLATGGDSAWGNCEPIAEDGTANHWFVALDDGGYYNVEGKQVCSVADCHAYTYREHTEGFCEEHAWKEESFVELHPFGNEEGDHFDEEIASRYENLMAGRGWTVEVREPRNSEAEGTYYRRRGDLQILGYSMPVPEVYRIDSEACYAQAIDL